jgi:hypothetical protein
MGSQVLVSRPTGSWPERGSQKLACHFKPKQLKLALVLGAPPMDPFFYSEEAGAKGLPPLSPAPQIPAQPKPSLRNAVRLPPESMFTFTVIPIAQSPSSSPLPSTAFSPAGAGVGESRSARDPTTDRIRTLFQESEKVSTQT